jgi:hypothetical protein
MYPLRQRLPLLGSMPTIRHASLLLKPCCMSWKYAARSAVSLFAPCGFRFSRILKFITPLELGCCDDH